jgi:hypothetical protein
MPPAIGLAIFDTYQKFLLRLLSKPLQLRHASGHTRLVQRRDARDPEFIMEPFDFLRSEPGNLQ